MGIGLRTYVYIAIVAGISGFVGNVWMFITYAPPVMAGEPLFFRYIDLVMCLLFCIAGYGVSELKENFRKLAIFIARVAIVESFLKVISAIIISHSFDPLYTAILFFLPVVIFNVMYLITFDDPSIVAIFAGPVVEKRKLLEETDSFDLFRKDVAIGAIKEDVKKSIDKLSIIISVVVVISMLVTVFVLKSYYLAAILSTLGWGILIFLFRRYRSRIAALIMTLLSVLEMLASSAAGFILLWLSVRAIWETFSYHAIDKPSNIMNRISSLWANMAAIIGLCLMIGPLIFIKGEKDAVAFFNSPIGTTMTMIGFILLATGQAISHSKKKPPQNKGAV